MSDLMRYALTAYQRDIWAIAELHPGVPSYLCCAVWHLAEDIDVPELLAAAERTLRRNDGLRMRYGTRDGVPYQELSSDWVPPVRLVDVADADDPESAAQQRIRALTNAPIDLTGPEPVRFTVIRAGSASYYLVTTAHHVTVDATSLRAFGTELLTDYTVTSTTGAQPELPGSSFVECLTYEQEYRASEQYGIDRDAFVPRLRGVVPALFDRRHGVEQLAPIVTRGFSLERELVNRIRAEGISLYPYLCTMIGVYLSRVLRTENVIIGIPQNNRNNPTEQAAVGHFANTLPLLIRTADSPTVADLVATVKADVRQMKRHQRYPLGDLVGELRRAGESVHQLFDVTVSYLRLPISRGHMVGQQGVRQPPVSTTFGSSSPDGRQAYGPNALAWTILELDEEGPLHIRLDYAADVFDDDYTIESVVAGLISLLESGISAMDANPAALSVVPPTDYDTLIDQDRATDRYYDDRTSVISAMVAQAERTPEAIALHATPEFNLTYRELIDRVSALSALLRGRGVGLGDVVAVMLDRSPDMMVAILAAMHAGATYVPVDPRYPADRIEFLLVDSAATVLLTDAAQVQSVPPTAASVLTPEEWTADPSRSHASSTPVPGGHDLAYMIYTSGSTGTPKGVAVEHHSVINRLSWMQRRYPLQPTDVILQKTPISFDVSVWELFWWALTGAQMALLKPGGEKDPRDILAAIAEFGVTVMHFVPSMLTPFLDVLESDPAAVLRADTLRTVFCSGEALLPHQVARWNRVFAIHGEAAPRLINLYGPTEATVDVSYHDCPRDPGVPITRVPIGRPIDNTRLYVLDPADQPQPVGVPGELCIAGVGVARGYRNRPELDAEKFVADPFHPGERMYRTGDLARWLSTGELEYLGRIDRQVKIRGNRVELGEVENALAALPEILAAAVIDIQSPTRGTYLAAYCVSTTALDPRRLRETLAKKLPEFMIPARFVGVPEIPLTPSGKADRTALAATSLDDDDSASHVAPQSAVEEQLAAVWREVLGRDSVSVIDSFYDLGGDSILLLRVLALSEARGLLFTARDLAESPTISELAGRVRVGELARTAVEPFELVAVIDRARLSHVVDAYPLTRLQLGMLFHSRERHGSALYHDVFRYSVRMDWHEPAMRAALAHAVDRHPMLRTSFDLAGYSEPLQLVHTDVTPPLTIVDLRSVDTQAADTTVAAHVAQRRTQPYHFETPGLFHLAVFRRADRIDLVLSFHHAILDGWSVSTLVSELLADYRALAVGTVGAPEPELPSFAEYVRAEGDSLSGQADREYWTTLLAGALSGRIPGVRPHVPVDPSADLMSPGARVTRSIPVPPDVQARVEEVAADVHLPLKTVLLAAHLCTIGLLAGQADITTGVVTHGRPERLDAERMVGLFLNTMPFRLEIDSARTWWEVLEQVFEQEKDSAPHRRFPVLEIQRDLGLTIDTAFNYIHFHAFGATLQALDVELLEVDIREETNFALLINAVRSASDHGLSLRLDADASLYTHDQLDLIGETYVAVLDLLTRDLAAPVDFSSLAPAPQELSGAEAGSLALQQVEASLIRSDTGSVIDLFGARASQSPEAVAIEFGSQTVTYAELFESCQRIATALVARGVQAGDRIALAVDRSPEQIAAVLGIGMAGAACVPLDVSYPPSRLHAMLDQAAPFAVITGPEHKGLVPARHERLTLEELVIPSSSVELPTIEPALAAYILFTSGSTGTPKGVVMPHRALANLIAWQLSTPSGWLAEHGRSPATTQFAPLSFDVSFQEIYSTLCGGGRLILLTEQQRRDLPALPGLLSATDAERVFLPYVALQQMAEAAVRLGSEPTALRVIISSGEQLRVTDEIRALCAAGTDVILENQYGPTETHVATRYSMTGDPSRFPVLPPIGTAIDNVEILVLDERLRPVPDGVPGEICLGGAALADGYLNRPDLTDAVFVPHPTAPAERLYRTGDIGRRLPDGAVVSDGRRGGQAKIRGHRVEPMEVELALQRVTGPLPGVTEVAVVAHDSTGGSSAHTRLVAFMVGSQADVDEADIIAALREWLPEYMIPARLVWLNALPLTPSGKRADAVLARMELPAIETAGYVPPRTPVESTVAALMAEALGLPEVGVHDDFFALGGTSLTAVRLIVSLDQRFGVSLPVSVLATGPTVAALAVHLEERPEIGFDPLVRLRAGAGTPLFLAPPIGGNVLCYVELGKHLPLGRPLYGLQAPGLQPGSVASTSLPETAAMYVEAIRQIQPEGPYHLGGWSLGGMMAFEMAQQLTAAGHEVATLVLIDAMTVRNGDPTIVSERRLQEFFLWELLLLARGTEAARVEIPDGLVGDDQVFAFMLATAVDAGVLPVAGSQELVRRLYEVFVNSWRAFASYRPQPYRGAMTLLRAAEPLPEILRLSHDRVGTLHRDPSNGWQPYAAGRLDVIEVPGDHLTMITEPHVADVARQLVRLLDTASAVAS
ncbi:non-ribosomal peptide synthetase [Nocardia sp. CDC160]|uniref:non-ribosomal peptide synthetase n=1 Tax=Nocardia sp. CDC160 TaxID=3112166 RepID=UPI002DB85282|nr:non-ribosomal peptide synthetase [Nocardia sp. CDC160]MEC3917916.1 amino acid adenylation domain-containing protein [Nocardia sp. CDC160]